MNMLQVIQKGADEAVALDPRPLITETVFATDKLTLTVTRPTTQAEQDRYAAYLADKARCEAENAKADAEFAESCLVWLGERDAAVSDVLPGRSSVFELDVTIIGKTAEAVDAEAAAYCQRHDGKLPRFNGAQPWHQLFRITGTRRESI